MKRRGDYGYDAPYALIGFLIAAIISAGGALALWRHAAAVFLPLLVVSLFFAANAVSFLFTTRRGKFEEWERILDELSLRDDERVLDVGCGRGAVLTAVASRLRTGRVTGVDLWISRDQSGNSGAMTLRNAALEGVADRIDITTGDMRALPFANEVFDHVVSSLAIHNIPSDADRATAVAEAWRVLKPGGWLVIADIRATALYAATLTTLGASDVRLRRLGWRFWWGNPFAATTLVTAQRI